MRRTISRPRFLMTIADDSSSGGSETVENESEVSDKGSASEDGDKTFESSGGSDSSDTSVDEDDNEDTPLEEKGLKALRDERKARKQAQNELSELRKSLEDMSRRIDEIESENSELKMAATRADIAHKYGLPTAVIEKLKGSSVEELDEAAKSIADLIPAKGILPPDPSQGRSTGGKGSGSVESGKELWDSMHKVKE